MDDLRHMSVQEMFQSLIGRLRTIEAFDEIVNASEFQSLIGRLRTAVAGWVVPAPSSVSIPYR